MSRPGRKKEPTERLARRGSWRAKAREKAKRALKVKTDAELAAAEDDEDRLRARLTYWLGCEFIDGESEHADLETCESDAGLIAQWFIEIRDWLRDQPDMPVPTV